MQFVAPHTTSTIGWAEASTINVADLRLWQHAEDLTDAIIPPAYDTLTPDEASALVVGTTALQAALVLTIVPIHDAVRQSRMSDIRIPHVESDDDKVDRRPAYQRVADSLLEDLRSGALKPGDQLLNEAELGARFDVSRSTVREALRALSSQHLVVTSRGASGGTFMAEPDATLVSNNFSAGLHFLSLGSKLTVSNLLEAREMMEVPASRLAATRRTPEQLEELRETVDGPARGERSFQFHSLLLELSANPLLVVMTRPVFEVLRDRFLRDRAPSEFWCDVEHDHRGIFAAVEAGDPEAAAAEMTLHLRRLRKTYMEIDTADSEGPSRPVAAS